MVYRSLNFELGETNDMLVQQVRNFVDKEIAPIAASVDKDNEFPLDLWPKLGAMGLLGTTIDEQYGGTNMGYLAQTLVLEELARASASISLSYGAHTILCTNQIQLNGSPEQRAKYLPGLVAGTSIGALAISEPGAGSDAVGMNVRAEKVGDEYVLDGS